MLGGGPQPIKAEASALLDRSSQRPAERRFLFLQSLPSPLFFKLGQALEQHGSAVHRINFCMGDVLFWPRTGADFYWGRLADWRGFLTAYLQRHRITDIVLFGDRRPYHRIACVLARRCGIAVHAFDEGYLRPDWITMESDPHWRRGLGKGNLPRLSVGLPSPADHRRVGGGFARLALWNFAYQGVNTLLGLASPFYVRHRPKHPLIEGVGWVRRALGRGRLRRQAQRVQDDLVGQNRPFFLLPLQLDSDYQIRHRSPFDDMAEVMNLVMASFRAHAPGGYELVIKVHPLDNGLVDRSRQVAALASHHGLSGRVRVLDGGHLPTLIGACKGVVVVNSTTGLTALHQRKPTLALAEAVYNLPGLVSSGTLDQFWANPVPPSAETVTAFEKVMADRCQVNGSFYTAQGIDLAVRNIMRRLCSPGGMEPLSAPADARRDAAASS
jgi:capsular polysaccharide export protein